MPMHEKARARVVGQLMTAKSPEAADALLDELHDYATRATNWDAGQWGFDVDGWMERERAELAERGGRNWPTEPALRIADYPA